MIHLIVNQTSETTLLVYLSQRFTLAKGSSALLWSHIVCHQHLILLTTLQKLLTDSKWNLTWSKYSTYPTKFVFFMPIFQQRSLPWPLIGWDMFYFSYATAGQILIKLDMKQAVNFLYPFCVFRLFHQQRWLPCTLIDQYIFSFSSA